MTGQRNHDQNIADIYRIDLYRPDPLASIIRGQVDSYVIYPGGSVVKGIEI
jgi:hypothetical protein